MKKFRTLSIILIVLALLLAGCNDAPKSGDSDKKDSAETKYPVTWTQNFDGKDVEFTQKEAPKKAVSMSFATTEMMLALGLEDQMAGTCFKEDEVLPEQQKAYDKVKVLSDKWPSYEVLMAEKPDFVTGWPVPFTKRGIPADQLISANVNIFIPQSMISPDADLEMNFKDLLTLGEIFNKQENAQKFVDKQTKKLNKIQKKLKGLPEKRVFIFDSEDEKPFTVFEGYTTNILKLIGAKNVMSGKGSDQTWGQANWEDIVKENPEYFIIVDYSESIRNDDDFKGKVDKIKNNPLLKDLDAVKNDRFIKVRLSEITPGVRTVDALERLSKQIHEQDEQ